jgi:hypothetical protein
VGANSFPLQIQPHLNSVFLARNCLQKVLYKVHFTMHDVKGPTNQKVLAHACSQETLVHNYNNVRQKDLQRNKNVRTDGVFL